MASDCSSIFNYAEILRARYRPIKRRFTRSCAVGVAETRSIALRVDGPSAVAVARFLQLLGYKSAGLAADFTGFFPPAAAKASDQIIIY